MQWCSKRAAKLSILALLACSGAIELLGKAIDGGARIKNTTVAHWHVHQGPGAGQEEGSVAGQQEGIFT